jgi:hypothetical protein
MGKLRAVVACVVVELMSLKDGSFAFILKRAFEEPASTRHSLIASSTMVGVARLVILASSRRN